jgi:subtilisin family serine protease
MGLPGRSSLAFVLLLSLLLTALVLAPRAAVAGAAALAGAVDERRTPPPGSATLPVRGPMAAGAGSFVPGRVLVGFEAKAGEQGRRAAAAAVEGHVLAGTGRTRVVQLEQGADVRAAARRLADRPGVAFAEPDWVRRAEACDPAVCWHLQPRPGANVAAAHDDDHRGAGSTVAVVDTGVREAIPDNPATAGVDESDDLDLGDRVAARWRCRDNGCVAAVATPTSSHGTEVASVIAATDDGDGTTGVAPEATIVSYRVDATGGGIPISYLRNALLHIAADPAIDVVNLSLGGSQWSEAERQAIAIALAAGKVVVASAGNTGDRVPQYPAAFPGVISVGATDDGGQVADFSSFGKVDVVAPGDCVAVAVVPGFDQDRGCPGDTRDGVAFNSGTSFSAPIVSGVLALAGSRSPLVARLALEASADEDNPGGASDAKQWAHGLADATAFVDAHDPGAPPALVLETSGGDGGQHRLGSGDGQLPHPGTTYVAYAVQAGPDGVTANPGPASFTGVATNTRPFDAVDGDTTTFRATLGSGDLDPGLQEESVTATVDGEPVGDSVPVLALAADDQAPGVDLVDLAGDDAWRRLDSVDGEDLDDVYAVTLGRGDRLDVSIASRSADPVAALLFDPGTTDVLGQLDQARACGGGTEVGCPTRGLHFQATARGTYLLDVFSTGSTGGYLLTWTVRNAAGLPIEVRVPACSPNGDRVKDRCTWSAGALAGWTITSFVTRGTASASRQTGGGAHSWNGAGRTPGAYTLRVLYTGGGGRALLRTFPLTLDIRRPRIADARAAPNPFEPRPGDGDRDTTTFAMNSSERGRLRVVIYRQASTTVVRVLMSGTRAAGRQRVAWTGKTSAGAWLRGTFSYVVEATDAAGNTSRSQRHHVRVL